MSNHRLIIFDCDGTIVDSQHMIVSSMAEAFASCGLKPPAAEATRGIIGLSMMEAVSELHPGADTALVERIVLSYREAFLDRVGSIEEPLFDGADDAIRALAAHPDTVLGIATGKSQRGVQRLFERTGLGPCFITIQTADDAPSKPHPAMIERAMADAGTVPDATMMIGDTSFDMEMARNAGAHGLGVSWGYHPEDILATSGAHRVIHDFDQLQLYVHSLWADGGREADRRKGTGDG